MPSHLSETEIKQIYQQLDQMYVPLDERAAVQGLTYVRERLALCRAMLDQVHDIRLRVMVAYADVQKSVIFAKSQVLQAESQQAAKQAKLKLLEVEQLQISHRVLAQMVSAHNSTLTSTQRDIKSLIDIIKEQIKLAEVGGVEPHDAEIVTQADLSQVGKPMEEPVPEISLESDEPEPEFVVAEYQIPEADEGDEAEVPLAAGEFGQLGGFDDLSGLFSSQPLDARAHPGDGEGAAREVKALPPTMETVGFDDAVVGTPMEALPRGIPVADMSSVPIESLFEEESNGGTTPAYRAF